MIGKFLEYAKLLPKAIENADKIIEGHLTDIKMENGDLPEDEVEEILRRRVICHGCEFMSTNAKKLADFKTKRPEEFCVLCSCPIKKKTASLSSTCGVQYYNTQHPDKPMEVKWFPYPPEQPQENK